LIGKSQQNVAVDSDVAAVGSAPIAGDAAVVA